jgi:hypothetical protein
MFVLVSVVNGVPYMVYGPYENREEAQSMKDYLLNNSQQEKTEQHFVKEIFSR